MAGEQIMVSFSLLFGFPILASFLSAPVTGLQISYPPLSWPPTLSLHSLERCHMPVSDFSMEKYNTVQTPDFVTCGGSANLTTVRLESLIRRNILWLGFEAKHQGKRLENSGGEKNSLIKQLKFATQRNSSCPGQNSWKAAL